MAAERDGVSRAVSLDGILATSLCVQGVRLLFGARAGFLSWLWPFAQGASCPLTHGGNPGGSAHY